LIFTLKFIVQLNFYINVSKHTLDKLVFDSLINSLKINYYHHRIKYTLKREPIFYGILKFDKNGTGVLDQRGFRKVGNWPL